jgi:putative ABC transport system permease protein
VRLFRRLAYLWHRGRRDQDLADEMAWHRELAEQEQRGAGLSPDEARRAVNLQMGNPTLAREAAHHVWVPAALEGAVQDLRYAWRGLIRSKTLLVVACLSLGISTGFGTALFSVVNAVVLQPVSAARPESLVRVWVGNSNRISWLNLRDLCEATPGVACLGYRIEELAWLTGDESERVHGQSVSAHYFTALGLEAAQGRVFTAGSVREAGDTAVVTHAFWERRLAGDPAAVGRTLVLNGHRYTVIGVLPRGFRSLWGLGVAPSIYLPAGSSARPPTTRRGEPQYELLGVLAPGQSEAQFRDRVAARSAALASEYPVDNRELARVQMFPFHALGLFVSNNDQTMQVLVVFATLIVVFVLLLAVVACVNVAGLLVARAAARQHEFAVRVSIGCGRWRLARLLLAESLVLAVTGIALGAIASLWVARVLVGVPLPFPVPFEAEVPIDLNLLGYLALLVGLATVVVGVAPVLQAFRVSVVGGTGTAPRTVGHRRWSARGVLIGLQVALSTLLLVGTTLFVRSLWVASRIDPGFDIAHVVTVDADTRSAQLTPADTDAFYRAAIRRLKTAPHVTAVSAAAVVPLSLEVNINSLQVDGPDSARYATVRTNWTLPDYFRVMRIPLRAGREFADGDAQSPARVAIVNETFARQLFPGSSALGRRVRRPAPQGQEAPWAEIVGVVADSRYVTLGEEARPQVYWPVGPQIGAITIHARSEGDAASFARALQSVLATVDPRVRVRVRPLQDMMAVALFPARVAAILLAALGLVGWALTVAGVYGLVAYSVTRRIPEIGLRVALGAPPSSVMRLLLRDGLVIAVVGVTVGLAVAAATTPFLGALLAGVPPRDLTSFGLVAAGLVLTALAASYGPARRGTRLSPTDALRALVFVLAVAGTAAAQTPSITARPDGRLDVSAPPAGAVMRYTLDGSDPTRDAGEWLAPVAVPPGYTVKVRAVAPDGTPAGDVATWSAPPGGPRRPSTLVPLTQNRDWRVYDWTSRHREASALMRSRQPDIVMLGDSITHFWGGEPIGGRRTGVAEWDRFFAGRRVVNLGYGWDRTENVLWRLQNGEFEGVTPKVVVLMLGTNNITLNTPEEIAAGVEAVCTTIHERSPATKILLLAIFPRGQKPDAIRGKVDDVNRLIVRLDARDDVTFLDLGAKFLEADGTISADVMYDFLHPSAKGYAIWAAAMGPVLDRLLAGR